MRLVDEAIHARSAAPMTLEAALELTAGSSSVTIDASRGGRLASWLVDGRELLVGPPARDDRSIRWGCFLMAPWAGRLADGRYRTPDGRVVQLPRTHGRHAIHGLLWNRPWQIEEAGRGRAVLACELPADEWPPGGTVRHEIRLAPDRLDLAATVTASAAAGGHRSRHPGLAVVVGWHPWFRRDAGAGDLALSVDASAVLETAGMIPTGAAMPVAGATDLRAGPRLGRRRLDHAYVEAQPPAVLRWSDFELAISWQPAPATLVVHTPAGSVCVEPQTAWPNAPAVGDEARDRSGLRLLRPGESFSASMSMSVR